MAVPDVLTVVDVGASIGLLSRYMAKIPGVRVLAIEPLPDVAAQIPRMKNLQVLQVGIRDVTQPQSQLLVRSAWSELSSFVEINPRADPRLWSHHLPHANERDRLWVPVMSLECVFREKKVDAINFLKIDTQGIDLEVLASCGSFLSLVDSVCLEVPYSLNSSLYANEPDVASVIGKLRDFGFVPVRLVPNGAGEANLFAASERLPITEYFALEARLRFAKAPTLKIGPHRAPLWSRIDGRARRAVARFR